MKFSEVDRQGWEELQPYLDTCLIPITGLTGKEQPYEVTEALENLRDMMDWIEQPFHGRVVTYPSFQYGREEILSQVNDVCHLVKTSGFRYVIVISATIEPSDEQIREANLIVTPGRFQDSDKSARNDVKEAIQRMWQEGENARL